MTDWKRSLGPFGVWVSSRHFDEGVPADLERLGFGALWIGGAPGDLALVERALATTEHLVVATGIVNIFTVEAPALADAYHRVADAHPGRFLLGIGSGHPERQAEAARPYEGLARFLDGLDAGGVPADERVLAALGPRVTRLAGSRSAGAHPYLVTPEANRRARQVLGPGPLLATEQRVVLREDPAEARAIARPSIETPYLGLRNYRANLQRLGYPEAELDDGGSDRLIDDLTASGNAADVVVRLREHHAAGADHVAIQVLTGPGDDAAAGYAAIAEAAGLQPRG